MKFNYLTTLICPLCGEPMRVAEMDEEHPPEKTKWPARIMGN
jgi:hypothetical protein